ncbi:sensor histidine kinase [Hymenobacter psychrophilus]|uniref:histidine kinase n=1 Tax=Hymenobacter psychrophilus TaxID=651662 RepID=A0A1H3DJ95_9BACT|nr:histidine kinase [Hymenobacter psychrophilus]SDX66400.1 Signal transduction histidine kinase [Hymenobacter psychrophilus]
MASPEEVTFGQLLYGGIAFMLLAGGGVVAFLLMYQRRLLQQQLQLRTTEGSHQQQLLVAQQELLLAVVAAQEGEREDISQELHDGIGSSLSTAKLLLHHLGKNPTPEECSRLVVLLQDVMTTAVQEVRSISHSLYPAVLARHGLAEAIQRLTDICNETGQVPVSFTLGYYQPLGLVRELVLYRICQELVANALKHAQGATYVAVRLAQEGAVLKLEVQDDGYSFLSLPLGLGSAPAYGNALCNIGVRVQLLHARLHHGPESEPGTRITIELGIAVPHP